MKPNVSGWRTTPLLAGTVDGTRVGNWLSDTIDNTLPFKRTCLQINIFISYFICAAWLSRLGLLSWRSTFNSLVPGKFEWNFRYLIFQIISVIDGWGISCELAIRWMSLDLTDDKSTLVQVMAWCRQATNHYLSQCWPRYLTPYGVISLVQNQIW